MCISRPTFSGWTTCSNAVCYGRVPAATSSATRWCSLRLLAVRCECGSASGFDLAKLLGGGRLAVADPDSVPAGIYGREALQKLGVWSSVASRLVRAENVRAALEYVARGDAPLGIVYRTDALAEKQVRIVGVFPASSHAPIVYPVALTRRANGAAARYLAFISGAEARPIFRKWGFEPIASR